MKKLLLTMQQYIAIIFDQSKETLHIFIQIKIVYKTTYCKISLVFPLRNILVSINTACLRQNCINGMQCSFKCADQSITFKMENSDQTFFEGCVFAPECYWKASGYRQVYIGIRGKTNLMQACVDARSSYNTEQNTVTARYLSSFPLSVFLFFFFFLSTSALNRFNSFIASDKDFDFKSADLHSKFHHLQQLWQKWK